MMRMNKEIAFHMSRIEYHLWDLRTNDPDWTRNIFFFSTPSSFRTLSLNDISECRSRALIDRRIKYIERILRCQSDRRVSGHASSARVWQKTSDTDCSFTNLGLRSSECRWTSDESHYYKKKLVIRRWKSKIRWSTIEYWRCHRIHHYSVIENHRPSRARIFPFSDKIWMSSKTEIDWYKKKQNYLINIVKFRCLLGIWFALRSSKRELARNKNM